MSDIKSVAVVGGGFMGSGIAESCATAGVPVSIFEADPERRDGLLSRVEKSLGRAVKGGVMAEAGAACNQSLAAKVLQSSPRYQSCNQGFAGGVNRPIQGFSWKWRCSC